MQSNSAAVNVLDEAGGPVEWLRANFHQGALIVFILIGSILGGVTSERPETVSASAENRSELSERAEAVVAPIEGVLITQSSSRPAPAVWSSRFNVRWEARWGGNARYMV